MNKRVAVCIYGNPFCYENIYYFDLYIKLSKKYMTFFAIPILSAQMTAIISAKTERIYGREKVEKRID